MKKYQFVTIDIASHKHGESMKRLFILICILAFVGLVGCRDDIPILTPLNPDDDSDDTEVALEMRYVFVTSETFDGDILTTANAVPYSCAAATGIEGADCICTVLGTGLPGSGDYVAWLSDDTNDAIDALINDGKWYLVDGVTKIADTRADLIDGTIDHPIIMDESENNLGGTIFTFTGTNETGSSNGGNCSNWTATTGNTTSGRADTVTDEMWTKVGEELPCSVDKHLYCFEI